MTNLTQAELAITNHFAVPGQVCGFSNNIVAFGNIGTGAYQVQVKLRHVSPNVVCTWAKGDYLAQVTVASQQRLGQAPAKLSIQ